MSFQYDQYLAQHRSNVKRGYEWLCENLPDVIKDAVNAGWQTGFAHDQSKDEPDEYNAYDAYFYGNNRSLKLYRITSELGSYIFIVIRIIGNIGY